MGMDPISDNCAHDRIVTEHLGQCALCPLKLSPLMDKTYKKDLVVWRPTSKSVLKFAVGKTSNFKIVHINWTLGIIPRVHTCSLHYQFLYVIIALSLCHQQLFQINPCKSQFNIQDLEKI